MVAEGDKVEVVRQNLIFAQSPVNLRSHANLTQLTGNGLFSGSLAFFVRGGIDKQKVILYVLLVQR